VQVNFPQTRPHQQRLGFCPRKVERDARDHGAMRESW
jgi:hypothetical protein